MEEKIFKNYVKAGKIASEVREAARTFVKPGKSYIEIVEYLEGLIREKGGEPAFPVNISVNDIAAHYTPIKIDDGKIKESDVVKIDVGVHIDGCIGDTACTIVFDRKHDKLVEASKAALDAALKLCKPGEKLSDISSAIEETIKSYGFKPVSNLTGHGLEEYNLHAEPQVPNVSFTGDYRLKKDQVIAIEPFATDGGGSIKESGTTFIYMLVGNAPLRNNDARTILNFAEQRQGLPFAERWIPLDSVFKTRIALKEMRDRGILYDYPVLKEIKSGLISQAEHTVIVRDVPIITTL